MTLVEILTQEMENQYEVTRKLFLMVEPEQLQWKPQTGQNWMTLGQLMMHCASGCGAGVKAFVTNDWGIPEGVDVKDLPPEEMLPPAEKLPTVESVGQALQLLAEDRSLALATLARVRESDLLGAPSAAPWGGAEFTLFQHILHMVEHLAQHKGQLFYYLKLMGRNVTTHDLWGNI